MKIKIKIQILIILVLFTSTIAYKNVDSKNQESVKKTESKAETNHVENELVLNNGKRWIANLETTKGIDNMINLMSLHTDTENVESYKALSESLDSEFKMIFEKCTMKGEAHNQLHNYLFPMKGKIKKLSSDDLNQCKMVFDDLNKHLPIYKQFFE